MSEAKNIILKTLSECKEPYYQSHPRLKHWDFWKVDNFSKLQYMVFLNIIPCFVKEFRNY